MDVSFEGKTLENMQKLAEEAGLTPEGFIEVVMEQFVDNKGSRVYTGRWSKGEKDGEKGMRYVSQWPFRPGFKEAQGDKVAKWKSGGKKFRPHPTGEWPFYPSLKDGDIEHEYWQSKKMYHKSLIDDRKGRIVVLMENEKYEGFLEMVKARKGNFWASSVDAVMDEALADWMVKEE